MAHFYGVLQGSRGEATRLGTKASGVHTTAASWEGAVKVDLWYDEDDGVDRCTVWLVPWHGHGTEKLVYSGRVDGSTYTKPYCEKCKE